MAAPAKGMGKSSRAQAYPAHDSDHCPLCAWRLSHVQHSSSAGDRSRQTHDVHSLRHPVRMDLHRVLDVYGRLLGTLQKNRPIRPHQGVRFRRNSRNKPYRYSVPCV